MCVQEVGMLPAEWQALVAMAAKDGIEVTTRLVNKQLVDGGMHVLEAEFPSWCTNQFNTCLVTR